MHHELEGGRRLWGQRRTTHHGLMGLRLDGVASVLSLRLLPLISVVVVVVVVLLLLGNTAVVASGSMTASTPPTHRTSPAKKVLTSSDAVGALCPRCPLCASPHTPLPQRLVYCHSTARYVLSFFSSWRKAALAGTQRTAYSNSELLRQYPLELPFATDAAVRRQSLRDAQDLLLSRVRGQSHVVTPLLEVLRRKLAYPREPVVVHLAGDNGVGKSHTARLVSKALSLRCATDRDVCDAGDNLLTIAGTGFDGLSVAAARRSIVAQVMHHVERYPHGVILVDDLTALHPGVVTALAPLFGRASHFPEQLAHLAPSTAAGRSLDLSPASRSSRKEEEEATAASDPKQTEVDAHDGGTRFEDAPQHPSTASRAPASSSLPQQPPLSQLLIFITTDFGRQGRTMGKSAAEVEAMIQREFSDLYGTLLPAYTRTFVYHAFTTSMAEDVVRSAVLDFPCLFGEHWIASSTISDEAVVFLVQQHRHMWHGKENGHALRRLIEDELVSQLVLYMEGHTASERLLVRFELDESKLRVVLRLSTSSSSSFALAGARGRHAAESDDAATKEEWRDL